MRPIVDDDVTAALFTRFIGASGEVTIGAPSPGTDSIEFPN